MYKLDLVAKIYARLTFELRSNYPEAMLAQYPRGAKQLSEFISGYLNHTYEVARSDFYDTSGACSEEVATAPTDSDVYSFVLIKRRPESSTLGQLVRRPVRIHLNTGKMTDGEALNKCWRRFCGLKEVCQAVIYEELNADGDDGAYPATIIFKEVNSLFEKINNEPFSLWDFDDDNYDFAHFTENAAELLALGLLYPFEHSFEHQKGLGADFQGDLTSVDLLPIADHYKVPKRYVELMMTWSGLAAFVAKAETYLDSVD